MLNYAHVHYSRTKTNGHVSQAANPSVSTEKNSHPTSPGTSKSQTHENRICWGPGEKPHKSPCHYPSNRSNLVMAAVRFIRLYHARFPRQHYCDPLLTRAGSGRGKLSKCQTLHRQKWSEEILFWSNLELTSSDRPPGTPDLENSEHTVTQATARVFHPGHFRLRLI